MRWCSLHSAVRLPHWSLQSDAGENQFYWSLGAGFAVFLILLIVAVLPLGQSIHFVRTVISLLCSLIASALGGYAGANMRKKKRYSHIKK